VPHQIPDKCELRDVIHSFTPVLMGLGFLIRIETNSASHLLLIPLILGMLVEAVDDLQKAINQMKSSKAEETYA
jgi:hypothetical protein